MPRPPKPENLKNPLRKLRMALGAPNFPMPQHELGKILGISPETIKSLEAGRRRGGKPNQQIANATFRYLGALWNEERAEWEFCFTGRSYERVDRRHWRSAQIDRNTEIHGLCLRMILLLQRVDEKDFGVVSDTIAQNLADLGNRYGIELNDGVNLTMLPIWKDGKEPEWNEENPSEGMENIIGYRRCRDEWTLEEKDGKWRKRKPRLFDFRDKLTRTDQSQFTPSSPRRSNHSAPAGSPKTSSPQPR